MRFFLLQTAIASVSVLAKWQGHSCNIKNFVYEVLGQVSQNSAQEFYKCEQHVAYYFQYFIQLLETGLPYRMKASASVLVQMSLVIRNQMEAS